MSDIIINPALEEAARERFIARQTQRQLMDGSGQAGLAASRVYGYVLGRKDDVVAQAVLDNLSVRRLYRSLLRQHAFFHIPQAVAASSEEFPERHAEGCSIRLQASRAETSQIYLIIEIKDQRRKMPTSLSLFGSNEDMATLDLPAARNGVIQTIIDKASAVARLLSDPKTETFLR